MKAEFDFGKIIAYLLPGFVGLWGLSHHSVTLQRWFEITESAGGSLDNVSFVIVGSLAAGVVLSGFRWILFRAAFQLSVTSHYDYYKFYSGMAVAILVAFLGWVTKGGQLQALQLGYYIATLVTLVVLSLSAAEALRKYEDRTTQILDQKGGPDNAERDKTNSDS